MKSDAFGRLFGLSNGGFFVQIDPMTGTVVAQNATAFNAGGDWALLTYQRQIYFYGQGGLGSTEYLYDLTTNVVTAIGVINDAIIGAGAPACSL